MTNSDKAINVSLLSEIFGYSRKKFSAHELYLHSLIKNLDKPFSDWGADLREATGLPMIAIKEKYERIASIYKSDQTQYDLVSFWDEKYPNLLRRTDDAPFCLFYRGDISLLSRPAVAVVGTRNPTNEGVLRAEKLALVLTNNSFVVASGLAKGIDTAAHKSALKNNGKTVAVIGTPINRVYPKENEALQTEIAENGLIISQFPLSVSVTPANFPIRNYTMSGISAATIIVEAGETSGALIQAQQCLDQNNGRKLFILKNVLATDLRWPQKFKKLGATIIDDDNLNEVIPPLKSLTNIEVKGSNNVPTSFSIKIE